MKSQQDHAFKMEVKLSELESQIKSSEAKMSCSPDVPVSVDVIHVNQTKEEDASDILDGYNTDVEDCDDSPVTDPSKESPPPPPPPPPC